MSTFLPPWFNGGGAPVAPGVLAPPAIVAPEPMARGARPGGYWTPQDILAPVRGFIDPHRQAIMNLGAGIASGSNFSEGLAAGARGLAQGDATDVAYAAQKKAETDRIAQIQATADSLRKMGFDDLAQGVTNKTVAPTQAMDEAFKRKAPGYGQTEVSPGATVFDQETGKPLFTAPKPDPGLGAGADDIVGPIADGIMSGDQPPILTGLYKYGAPVRAELAKRGYDLTHANQDYVATQRMLSSMNGPQQLRLRQAVSFTKESLGGIEDLATQWDAGKFPVLNKVTLESAKQGFLGQDAQSLATRLDSQINDMVSELGTVYKGGNSSTDESLKLAASNLNASWSKQTLLDAIKQIKTNLTYRENSINLVTTAGIPNSQYNPMQQPDQSQAAPAPAGVTPAPAAPAAGQPAQTKVINGTTYIQDANGDWYLP